MNELSHVGLMQCFYCTQYVGVLLDRYMRKVIPHRVCLDHTPCSECAKLMEQGIILISVDEEKSKPDTKNPWRTGGWVVVKEEAIRRMIHPKELVDSVCKRRVAFLTDEVWYQLGLPGIKAVRDHVCRKCKREWTGNVVRGDTPNISGEMTAWCPACGAKATNSSPWRYVQDEGEPASAAIPKIDNDGKVV